MGKLQRLQAALEQKTVQSKTQTEMDEFRLGKGHGIRNQFLNRKGEDEEVAKKKPSAAVVVGEAASAEAVAKKQQRKTMTHPMILTKSVSLSQGTFESVGR